MNELTLFDNTMPGVIIEKKGNNTVLVPEVSNRSWNQLYCQRSMEDPEKLVVSLAEIQPLAERLLMWDESLEYSWDGTWEVSEEALQELLQDDEEALFKLVDVFDSKLGFFKSEETVVASLRYIQFENRCSLERAFLLLECMSSDEVETLVERVEELVNHSNIAL